MSKTPRTDAIYNVLVDGGKPVENIFDLARQLERELAEAQADADHWKGECNALQRMVHEAMAEIERKDETIDACSIMLSARESLMNKQSKLIEQMREALEAAKQDSLFLSEYYLDAFGDYKDKDEIQGWPKIKWVRALRAYRKIEAALAAAERGE